MAQTSYSRRSSQTTKRKELKPLFYKENYKWMIIGIVIITIGMMLMAGGKNDPESFDFNKVYSFRRVTLAPIVILAGLALEIVAIFKKPKNIAVVETPAN